MPAKLLGETVPDVDLRFVRPDALRKAPLQNFLIRAALLYPFDDRGVSQIQKTGEQTVERAYLTEVSLVIFRQFTS